MSKSDVTTILSRASTDAAFYKSLSTSFERAVASYTLTSGEEKTLRSELAKLKPPAGAAQGRFNPAQSGAN